MKDEKVFSQLYAKLNQKQKEAVDAIEGPVMVMAGPGTGKTQILTLRIANILRQTDTAPEQILALTFTEAGASIMRKRLAEIVGVAAYRVPIFTFHGFCNEVINRFSEYFPEIVGSRTASELDRVTIMRKVFDDAKLTRLASFRSSYHYVGAVLRSISLLKREAIGPDELDSRLNAEEKEMQSAPDYRHQKGAHKGKVKGIYLERESALHKNRELKMLYGGYEASLATEKLYDFDDMIVSVVKKLEESEELRLILQEEYQYILADEHQDANGAQNKVLDLLASFHKSPNLFIVGDEKQAIYRFQGASLGNFLYFKKKFSGTFVIDLEENYRSTQAVLDAASGLIPNNQIKLRAMAGKNERPIEIAEYLTADDEADGIAADISQKIKDGAMPEEVAVFTRTNKELAIYAAALSRAGVPVSIQTKEDVLDDPHIEKVLMLASAAAKIGEDAPLFAALHLDCFNVPELDIFLLAREVGRRRSSVWAITRSPESLQGLRIQSAEEILRVVKLVSEWGKLGQNISPAALFSRIAYESGVISQMLASADSAEKLEKLSVVIKCLSDYLKTHRRARINELESLLKILDEYNTLEVNIIEATKGKIRLSTAHRAKGLEFDYVYIVGANEGRWSGRRGHTDFKIPGVVSIGKDDEEADDRRLFYVAMTRSRHGLNISYAIHNKDGGEIIPSRFLEELPANLISKKSFISQTSAEVLAGRFAPVADKPESMVDMRDFVRETLVERGLSVTGLNNYLNCPWQYFYRTFLQIPEPQTVSLMFGNVIHRSLKAFFDAWAGKVDMDKGALVSRFYLELNREALTDKELEGAKKQGEKVLVQYYNNYYPSWIREIKNEFPVNAELIVGDFTLRLTGKLDKLEFIKDNYVSVTDYKTGKPKKGSEDYKRQIVFYKVLLDTHESGRYKMGTGVIDFIEPDDKGRFYREEFNVSDDDAAELRQEIKRVAKEILDLSFWNKRCDDTGCRYCQLRAM